MKIKGAIITGAVFIVLGGGLAVYAASRADYDMDKIVEESNLTREQQTFNEDNLNSISYNGKLDYLSIVKSSEVEDITINYTKSDVRSYTFAEVDGTLEITQKFKNNWLYKPTSFKGDMDISFEIIVPNSLTSIDIDLDAGYITSSSLEVEQYKVKVDAGYIESKNITTSDSTFKVASGYIKYNGVINNSMNAKVKAGYINVLLNQEKSEFTVNDDGEGTKTITTSVNAGYNRVKFN